MIPQPYQVGRVTKTPNGKGRRNGKLSTQLTADDTRNQPYNWGGFAVNKFEEVLQSLEARHNPDSGWRGISSAPRDGTEILLFVPDIGEPILARFVAPCEFLYETELEQFGDDWEEKDWFFADFVSGARLNDGIPTHWMPLPPAPEAKE